MKVILSRKGFDSSAGGHASPILPDGTMLSLPIPSSHDSLSYGAITAPGGSTLADIIHDLAGRARIAGKGAHLDPDLERRSRPRLPGWRPSFGQIGAASGHLRNQDVGPGDLFLFYGWFRQTAMVKGGLRFVPNCDGFHAIGLMLNAKKGISAKQLQRDLGIGGYKTAWYLNHRIREAMREGALPPLGGIVEIDETYLGGRQRGHAGKLKNKDLVIGLRQRKGPVRYIQANDRTSETWRKIIAQNLKDAEVEYQLVTSEEADAAKGLISTTSPIGKALLGRQVGDEIKVRTPAGVKEFELVRLKTIHDEA